MRWTTQGAGHLIPQGAGHLILEDWKTTDQTARPENVGPENAEPENDGLEFDGPEQRAVMSLVQEHMHTLKTVPISLCRHAYFKTVFFTVGQQICSYLFFNSHFRFVFLLKGTLRRRLTYIFFSFNKKFNISHFYIQSLDSQFLP